MIHRRERWCHIGFVEEEMQKIQSGLIMPCDRPDLAVVSDTKERHSNRSGSNGNSFPWDRSPLLIRRDYDDEGNSWG